MNIKHAKKMHLQEYNIKIVFLVIVVVQHESFGRLPTLTTVICCILNWLRLSKNIMRISLTIKPIFATVIQQGSQF